MFDFEGSHCPHRFATANWQNATYKDEYRFVKDYYFPWMEEMRKGATFLDLGHHTLYFIEALVDYLMHETQYRFVVVRIRRSRYEAAVSLSFGQPGNEREDVCNMRYRFCPHDRVTDVAIPATDELWLEASAFQKTLWLIDEVEERWRRLLLRFPSMERVYIHWSSVDAQSFYEGAFLMGKLLRIAPAAIHVIHTRVHAGNSTTQASLDAMEDSHLKEDREYRVMFNLAKYANHNT